LNQYGYPDADQQKYKYAGFTKKSLISKIGLVQEVLDYPSKSSTN